MEKPLKEQMEKPLKGAVIIYFVNYLTNLLINFDHGIIPACTREMKADLLLDDFQLGMLGSAVYGGLVMGSVAGSQLISIFHTKKIVCTSVLGCIVSLGLFLMTKSIYFLFISRFLVGFFQIFLVVFFPVWIDFFGGRQKTLWLTFMQLGVALGAVSGYLVTSLFVERTGNWTYPYITQIVLLVPCALFYMLVPEHMLDTSGTQQVDTTTDIFTRLSSLERLKFLLSNRIFTYTVLGLSSLFFVINGLQFWGSDYLRNVLGVPQPIVFKAYMVVSLSAPILGVSMGGLVMHLTGGYDGERALKISAIQTLLACLCGTPIPFLNDFTTTMVMLWFLLFFGGSVVPGVTGIMISSIPPNTRAYGNSIGHIIQELLGYLPSPMLYGLIVSYTGGGTSRWGMFMLITWSYTGVFFIMMAVHYQQWLKDRVEQEYQRINQPQEIELQQQQHHSAPDNQTHPPALMPQRSNSIPKSMRQSFFNELRHNTSMTAALSVVWNPRPSIDQSFIENNMFGRGGETHRRQQSLSQFASVYAGMVGRASMNLNFRERNEYEDEEYKNEGQQLIKKILPF